MVENMKRNGDVAIVTDSVAQVPEEKAAALGIRVVPSIVLIDGREYRDGIDLDPQELYRRMRQEDVRVQTTAPSLGQFINTFKSCIEAGDESVFYIGLTSQLSATFSSAEAAAYIIKEEFPENRIELFDSRTATIAQGFIAMEAAKIAAKGADIVQVLARADEVRRRVGFVASLETLKYLARGGRIGKLAYMMGSLIKILPVVTIDKSGVVAPICRVRGEHKVLERMIECVSGMIEGYKRLWLAIMHADASERAAELEHLVRKKFEIKELFRTDFTPVMGAHAGPGVIGLAYYYE